MTLFTIQSLNHGEISFRVRDEGGYLRVSGNGWDNKQPCDGGGFMGQTVMADKNTLEAKARKWWKSHLAAERKFT